jgi:hypothetical protein
MRRTLLIRQRLLALCLTGMLLLFSPVVVLFERPVTLLGVPLLYLYLFGVWAGIIAASAWILSAVRE